MNPYLLEFEIRERRREMLAEANRQRLVRQCNASKQYTPAYQGSIDRFLLALANLLIGIGEELKRRHTAPAVLEGDLCRE